MKKLKIHDWEHWQSYRKDRGQPPWIKIHRELMRNLKWVSLSDAERGQLVQMWLLAADHNGIIPAEPSLIQKLCYMEQEPNINKFIDLQFIENDGVNVTSMRRQDDQPEAEAEAEKETDTPPNPPKGGKRFDAKGVDLPSCLNRSNWEDFVEHRRQLRKPLTKLAVTKLLNQLQRIADDGGDPNNELDRAVANGWRGVFPDGRKPLSGRQQQPEFADEIH